MRQCVTLSTTSSSPAYPSSGKVSHSWLLEAVQVVQLCFIADRRIRHIAVGDQGLPFPRSFDNPFHAPQSWRRLSGFSAKCYGQALFRPFNLPGLLYHLLDGILSEPNASSLAK
jgi:hypothetical protein